MADPRKFTDYLLNPTHPIGVAKARFFSDLGWGRDRANELREWFLSELPYVEGRFSRENEFNGAADYRAVIPIPRENGELVPVGTFWQVHPEEATKFVTAYPVDPE